MTSCDLQNGVRIKFTESNIELIPFEVSVQNGISQNAHVRAKVSLPAGELVDDSAHRFERVELRVGGILQDTYMYPKDGVTLGAEKQAWIQLDATERIFDQAIVSGRYEKTTLGNVVEQIFLQSKITKSVIDGYRIEDGNLETDDPDSLLTRIRALDFSSQHAGFSWDQVSGTAALNEVAQTFGVTYTVNRNNVLILGSPQFISQSKTHYLFGSQSIDGMKLREYTVTKGNSRVGRVVLNGSLKHYRENVDGTGYSAHLQPIAEAWIPGSDGDEVAIERKFEIEDSGMLERRAKQILLNSISDHKFGNIVFNSGSSTPNAQEHLAQMEPGDVFVVESSGGTVCGNRVYGGTFSVNSVQQKINTRVGWETIVEVSMIPRSLESSSVYYDPRRDEEYENKNEAIYNL